MQTHYRRQMIIREPSISPELRLAAACAIWPPSDRRTEAIRTALTAPIVWPRFLRVARRHQVLGLVQEGLGQAKAKLPREIEKEITATSASILYENLAMAREAVRLQRQFDNANLPVLFLKGSALAVRAFGSLNLRANQDIDLLVPYETLVPASVLLIKTGYQRYDPSPDIRDAQLNQIMPLRKDLGFVHQDSGIRIEVHWRLFLNPHAMSDTTIMSASQIISLAGAGNLRTLGDEDLFTYLCMHGALHWWNRLKWLADINALLGSATPAQREHLFHAAAARGAARAALQGLLLCQAFFGTNGGSRQIGLNDSTAILRFLAWTAINAINTGQGEGDPHATLFGTTRGSLSAFLLNPSWRYQRSELRIHLINQTDVQTIALPNHLRFLYAFLRLPLWLWRHLRKMTPGQKEHW